MTTLYPVTVGRRAPYSFRPVLDGFSYAGLVTWSLAGQYLVLNLTSGNGVPLLAIPLKETPAALPVASATYDALRGRAVVTTAAPHPFKPGTTTWLTSSGFTPDGYNGRWLMLATNETTLAFESPFLDDATTQGSVSQDLNLVEGYFQTSTLLYRAGQIEVSP